MYFKKNLRYMYWSNPKFFMLQMVSSVDCQINAQLSDGSPKILEKIVEY